MPARGDSNPPGDSLGAYRAKRSPDRSPEPVGTVSPAPGHLFVIHKHGARQLHWDLRLEMDGVLKSWAVPRGPSYDMADKRLAVHVEDHPLEYGDFEGVIPRGNYGAGGMIVWDRGEWVPLEDWREGLEKGKLLFELKGYKLHGKWTLVKIKKSEKEWLLIKERDAYLKSPGDQFPEESVLSGLTVEEIAAGESPGAALRTALAGSKARRVTVEPSSVKLMLAEPAETAFTRDDWLFELKLDGYRMLAARTHGDVVLLTRNGNDYTHVFPEIARAVKALPLDNFILDGEVVALDKDGKPSFSRLQQRGRLKSEMEIRRATVEFPVTYFVFDLLAFEDFDLRPLPLIERREHLAKVVPTLGAVRFLDHIATEGEALLREVGVLGLEGIIAKKANAPYRAGRSSDWLKIKAERTADFVIVGFTRPQGSRSHLGALQLADMVNGTLAYAGRVGTGFSDALLTELHEVLAPNIRKDAPCLGPLHEGADEPLSAREILETKTTVWVEPTLVCEVRFREWTPDGLLRHAAFLRLRTDKNPRDCERQQHVAVPESQPEPVSDRVTAVHDTEALPPGPVSKKPTGRSVSYTNLGKIFWPTDKYTKGDLIDYYRAASPWLLPYLRNRPLVLTRFPDGIDGKSFYQKDAPEFAPEWIRTHPIWSEDTQREIRYFVCDDEDSLSFVANLGSIPLHIWASRCGSLELPDWCVLDLDPKEAPFSDVIRCAIALRELCEKIELPSYVKTTGKSGLHILIPLGRQFTYEQSRTLGELLARVVLRELKHVATITRHVTKRGDKVYLDYLQNRHGQTIVAPFSVRPLAGATVSMPLLWDEVNQSLDPKTFTIRNALARMDKLGTDPVSPVLEETLDLEKVLQQLAILLQG